MLCFVVLFFAVSVNANFLVNEGSRLAVEQLVNYKSANVQESVASSVANKIVGQVVQQPQISAYLDHAVQFALGKGQDISIADSLQLLQEGAQAYKSWKRTGEAFEASRRYVITNLKVFDFDKVKKDYKNNREAINIKLNNFKQRMAKDPLGKQVISTAASLAMEVARDFRIPLPAEIMKGFK